MTVNRRDVMFGSAAAAMVAALSAGGAMAQTALPGTAPGYMFLSKTEAASLEALLDRIIPSGGTGPGALEADVHRFIDRALATTYGAGDGKYMQGPYGQGEPTQGYQLKLTPAELYRTALEDLDALAEAENQTPFAAMSAEDQTALMRRIESGEAQFDRAPAPLFLGTLIFDAKSGYFADPIHGCNKDMLAWKMIGYPGAFSEMRQYLTVRERVVIEPVSLLQQLGEEI